MIFQGHGQETSLAGGSMNVYQEDRDRGLLPSRWESISSSIPSPLTIKKIWSIIHLLRGDRTYDLKSGFDLPCLSSMADLSPSIFWIGSRRLPILGHSEETGESQSRSPISSSTVRSFPFDLFRPESFALGKEGTEDLLVPCHPFRYLSKHGSSRSCR